MIRTDEEDEFDRIERENRMKSGQPYYWEIDAIQAAIRIEREACAELCEDMALLTNDIRKASLLVAALNIRARGGNQ
jgi:hypothetical protein